MSHVANVNLTITDLDALEKAVKELGGVLQRGKTEYKWFGRHVGDYPLPKGFTKADLGKCLHAIKFPTSDWEIGVVKNPEQAGTYGLLFDFWGPSGTPLAKAIGGQDGKRLKQLYATHAAINAAKKKGWICQRKTVSGKEKVIITVP